MVVRQCSDTSAPNSQYSQVDRNKKPLGRCGFNVVFPSEKANRGITQQLSGVRIRTVSSIAQTSAAWSCRCMRVVMFVVIDRILKGNLRTSSVF